MSTFKPQSENRSSSPSSVSPFERSGGTITTTHRKYRKFGTNDQMIPWPPMVVVLNTRLGKQDGSDKWVGMGNRDLLDFFKKYEPINAKSAYNYHGHCGASLLTFNSSVLGYHQAEELHNRFKQEGRGKYEWHKEKPWKQLTIEKRLLYGYMATKEEELTMFSTHRGNKQKLKYEMKPYQMVVGIPLKQMHESMQKRPVLEREIAKEIEQSKDLDKKLRQRDLEIEATRRLLTEQSVEHNEQIESMNVLCERLSSKLKESEIGSEMLMPKQSTSSPHAAVDDQDEVTESGNQKNDGDGEHDSPGNGMDETAEEKLGGACDSGDKKKETPSFCGIL